MENRNYNDRGNFNKDFNRTKAPEPVHSAKFRAGRRRTYFFDVRATKQNDYYLTITESKKRMDGGYDRHKIFLYKEDFNKFLEYCTQTINHVKTELMPEYDFDEFSRKQDEWEREHANGTFESASIDHAESSHHDEHVTEEQPSPPSAPPADSHDEPSSDVNTDDLKW